MKINYDETLGQLEILFTLDERIEFDTHLKVVSTETLRKEVEKAIRDEVFEEREDPCEDCEIANEIANDRCLDCTNEYSPS